MAVVEEERRVRGEEPVVARLPLFSRCPITNKARLETPSGQVNNFFYSSSFPTLSIQKNSKVFYFQFAVFTYMNRIGITIGIRFVDRYNCFTYEKLR